MPAVDELEAERGDEFVYRWGEELHTLPDPAGLDWADVVAAVQDPVSFVVLVAGGASLSVNEATRLQADWIAHFGLGGPSAVAQLVYLVEQYRSQIEYDLDTLPGPHPSFSELWHGRQVRRLLNLINHLPPNSHTNAAIANNDEHVKMMVDAGLKPAKGVSQVYYGSLEQRLDDVADLTARVGDLLIAVNSPKGKRTQPTKARPRPTSAFGKIRNQARLEKHRNLMGRLFPDGPQPEQPAQRVAGGRRRDRRVLDGTAVVDPLATSAFVKAPSVDPTREGERIARWKAREAEVGRVSQSSPPVT